MWPFAIVWPIFLRFYLSQDLYDKYIGGQEWTFVWCGTILTVQSLFWLSTHWSVNLQALFTASKAQDVQDAKLIKVLPVANAGLAEICKIERDNVSFNPNISCLLILTYVNLGWWQKQHLLPISEATFPLQPRKEAVFPLDLCH